MAWQWSCGGAIESVLSRRDAKCYRQRAEVGLADWNGCYFPGAQGILAGLEAQTEQKEILTCHSPRAHFATIRFDEYNGDLSTERRVRSPSARQRHGGLPRALS